MKSRIDTSGTTFVCTRAPEPRTAFDTGQPKIDQPTGLPLWLAQLMALDSFGGEVIAVTVAGDPKITVGHLSRSRGWLRCRGARRDAPGLRFAPRRPGLPAPRCPVSSQRRRLIQPRIHPAIQVSRRLSPSV